MSVGDPANVPDATLEIRNLLRTHWNDSFMPYDGARIYDNPNRNATLITTGWYDRAPDLPVVTVTGKAEGPLAGGTTGWTATHGPTGKPMQRVDGYVSVNFVAGSESDLENTGPLGEDISPKAAREAMYRHGAQILSDTSGTNALIVTAPGGTNELTDDDDNEAAVFRTSMRAGYQYDRYPNPQG